MESNIEKYKSDLEQLIDDGDQLLIAMRYGLDPTKFKEQILKSLKSDEKVKEYLKKLPRFKEKYQSWYSESVVLVKQLLPDRLADFTKFYEKPKTRKELIIGNYVIEDYLQGIQVTATRGLEKTIVVGPDAAVPQFEQQLSLLKSVKRRFESSLFDVRQLVQADIFDSELETAKELAKHKFIRASGAICGVILEKHLDQVRQNHNIPTAKKHLTINDLNELLKNNNVIDTIQWRFIQHLGDIRNLCDHNKDREPTIDEANDLINGVEKIIKTTY